METHAAPIDRLLVFSPALGDLKRLDDRASPLSAIRMRAFALRRSTRTYNRYIEIEGSGEEENEATRGRTRGAYTSISPHKQDLAEKSSAT